MSLSRRDFIKLAGLVAASATLPACAPLLEKGAELAGEPAALATWPTAVANATFQRLNRLTYGPTLAERERAAAIGIGPWIEEQLAYQQIDDSPAQLRLRQFDVLNLEANALERWEREDVVDQFKQATLTRRIYSRRQLYENLVEFWTDHFNISLAKGDAWMLKPVDDREVIRPHVLAPFRELLQASAHSPAMLYYLDNQANHKDKPNENYAREVMELHTLGVDGGYTQEDVMELARCLTGWSVKENFWLGEFEFVAESHDDGVKQVLGHTLQPGGLAEGEQVLDILAAHPSTARYLVTKLVRRFISDAPERDAPDLIDKGMTTFMQTSGDLLAVTRVILLDGLADEERPLFPKFKRPVHFITSALRLLNVKSDCRRPVFSNLSLMGQPDFEWPTPDGPPDTADAWMRNLMPRWQFSLALTREELPRTTLGLDAQLIAGLETPDLLDHLSQLLLGEPFNVPQRQTLLTTLSAMPLGSSQETARLIAAGLLASPSFQWR